MNIELKKEKLILSNVETLPDYHIGSLEFLGFEKRVKVYIATGTELEEILIELIELLREIGIDFYLCNSSRRVWVLYNEKLKQFENLKDKAAKFKDGEIRKKEIQEFYNELRPLLSSKRELKDHQIKAAYHLYTLQNGANFSVPGSGKTSVVLSVYEKLKKEGKVDTLFVVGPLSCFGPWRKEFELTLDRKPKYSVLAGGEQSDRKSNYYVDGKNKSELYLTSFQTLLFDQEEAEVLFNNEAIKIFLVIDEAHYIKRIDGEWAKAVLRLSKLAKFRCILSGTPMPKSYTDAFNLFDFLWPDDRSIGTDTKARIKHLEESKDFESASSLLLDRIYPLFYRVMKKDLNLKDQVFHFPIQVKMNHFERLIYTAIKTRIEEYTKEDYARNIDYISKLYRGRVVRLRQALSYTGLLRDKIEDYDEDLFSENSDLKDIVDSYSTLEVPGKITALIEKVKELKSQKRKVVIWAHFIGTLELISFHLSNEGYYCKMIYGGIPIEKDAKVEEETREQIRDEFVSKSSGLDILIANPGACSESISLHTACQDAIYYDLSYNCAQYLQSLDRIHRVGGSEKVKSHYYFLQYKDTLENDILTNVQRKADKMFKVIEKEFEIYSLDMSDDNDALDVYKKLFKRKDI